MEDLSLLSDEQIVSRLDDAVAAERESVVEVLRCLIEFERRRLFHRKGYPSSFAYCRQKYQYSESAAYKRIHSARAARDFPVILDLLIQGRVHLSGITTIAPHLTLANHKELLAAIEGKRHVEISFLAASLSPRFAEREYIRITPSDSGGSIFASAPFRIQSLPMKDRLEPLSADTIRIAFTASKPCFEKLERAKGLLKHKFPFGGVEQIVEQALEDLLDKRDPERRIKRKKPIGTPARVKTRSTGRRIPQAVKDEAWKRDGGRCAYVGQDGLRCAERDFLEYDHVVPFALGGRSDTAKNVRLLCRSHNQEAGRALFGGGAPLAVQSAQKVERADR